MVFAVGCGKEGSGMHDPPPPPPAIWFCYVYKCVCDAYLAKLHPPLWQSSTHPYGKVPPTPVAKLHPSLWQSSTHPCGKAPSTPTNVCVCLQCLVEWGAGGGAGNVLE